MRQYGPDEDRQGHLQHFYASCLVGLIRAKGEALKSANAYCASQGKFVQLQTQDAHECALHGGCGEATITFLCLDENDPRYTSTLLRKDNGVNTIEVR